MKIDAWKEIFVEQNVNYIIDIKGKFLVIENVPARVCLETGERFFSPETVERIQKIAWEQKKPHHIIQTPVFEFATA